jgi:alkaline phosphatase
MKNRLFRMFTLSFAAAVLFLPLSGQAAQSKIQAKNVILLIGDGMGPSQFGAAWIYSNRVLNRDLRMSELMKKGRTAYLVNDTADAIVTESAVSFTR